MTEYNDIIDMNLNDPNLRPWDGKMSSVDPGEYVFECEKVSVDQSRKGNPTLVCNFKVISDGTMKGRSLRQSYAIMPDNDASRRRMKNLVEALGAQMSETGQFSAQSLIGCRMIAEVVLNEWNDTDPRTGQPVVRHGSKIQGEKPYVEDVPVAAVVVAAPAPQPVVAAAPAVAPAAGIPRNAPRRTVVAAPPPGNGQPPTRR